jgi:hypothetical protein
MPIATVSFRSDAAAEVHRIAQVRMRRRVDDEAQMAMFEAGGPWIARIRRAAARRAFAGRIVLVWRVALEDAGGRMVESRLVPLAVDVAPARRRGLTRAGIGMLAARLADDTEQLVEQSGAAWRQEAAGIVRRFAAVRLAREHGIAAAAAASPARPPAYQPGLFDRRTERERRSIGALAAAAQEARVDRLRGVESFAAPRPRPPQLMLVFLP